MRLPEHIGIIPDGNRRWAEKNNLNKAAGYTYGLEPGLRSFKLCQKLGVSELTFYGFTMDNTKRKKKQTQAFTKACIESVRLLTNEDASILVVGNTESKMFPKELLTFTKRKEFGTGETKVNFLINYSWHWDLAQINEEEKRSKKAIINSLHSSDISKIDLIIRWGQRRRLSGFLPAQSVYADFYVVDKLWPDFNEEDIYQALEWYDKQDITLGG